MSYRISSAQRKAFNTRRYKRYQSRHRSNETPTRVYRDFSVWAWPARWEPEYSIGKRYSKQQLDDWFYGAGSSSKSWDFLEMIKQGLLTIIPQSFRPMREMGGFSVTAGAKK